MFQILDDCICMWVTYKLFVVLTEWSPGKVQLVHDQTSLSASKFCWQPALSDNPASENQPLTPTVNLIPRCLLTLVVGIWQKYSKTLFFFATTAKQTDTWIHTLCAASMGESGQFHNLLSLKNNLTWAFNGSILLLSMNFVITLLK